MPRIFFRHLCFFEKAIFIICVLVLTNGCATKISLNMLQPAEFHQASLTKTVAVLPFTGPGGPQITSEVEGVLGSISIDGKNYFTVVDRNAIDRSEEHTSELQS